MAYKFNPFTASFDLIEDNIKRAKSIYVDSLYGNDSTGLRERIDKPFQTLEAAWNSLGVTTGTWNIYIANGAYQVANTLLTQQNQNITIICESTHGVIVTYTGINTLINNNGTSGARRIIEIRKGTWIKNAGNLAAMFESYNIADFYFYDCNVIDNISTPFYTQTCRFVKNCRVTSTIGNLFLGASAGNPNLTIVEDSYLEALGGNVFSANARQGLVFKNSEIKSLTGTFLLNNGASAGGLFDNCILQSFSTTFQGRPLGLTFQGHCSVERVSAGSVLIANTLTSQSNIVNNGKLIFIQESSSNAQFTTRSSGNGGTFKLLNTGELLYTDGNDLTQAPNAGAIGRIFNTSTIGNDITINLPAPYNTAPIVFNVVSAVLATTLADIKTAIDTQVNTPGTVWEAWCQGDDTNVVIGANFVRVFASDLTPGNYILVSTTNYVTETGTDLGSTFNVVPSGVIVYPSNGTINAVPRNELTLGGTRIIELYKPNLGLRTS